VTPQAVKFICQYGHQKFVAAVRQGQIMGFQFHPERSGPAGLRLLSETLEHLSYR